MTKKKTINKDAVNKDAINKDIKLYLKKCDVYKTAIINNIQNDEFILKSIDKFKQLKFKNNFKLDNRLTNHKIIKNYKDHKIISIVLQHKPYFRYKNLSGLLYNKFLYLVYDNKSLTRNYNF